MNLEAELNRYFGFESFRTGQKEVVEAILSGHSSLAVFSTGSGKSLCFQLPALLLPGLTVVVSPLIALMKDQVDFLNAKGIGAVRLDSTLTFAEIKEETRKIENGTAKMVYLSPEKLASSRWQNLFARLDISLMVIDEAHCISEWGHNFRPDYMKLEQISKIIGAKSVLGLTATATQGVIEDIERCFSIKPEYSFLGEFFRPELAMHFSVCDEGRKNGQLAQHLKERAAGPTLVYVTLQKTAEQVAAYLQQSGLPAVHYHAGMRPDKRMEVQNDFMASSNLIVVATIAFGMGVDKSNIRYVYHYNLPKSLENYIQETGRAGRDRQSALCEVLASPEDVTVLKNFIYGDTPEPAAIRSLLNYLWNQRTGIDVSIYELSSQFNIRTLVLNTFLAYLELDGILKGEGRYFSQFKVSFITPKAEILTSFNQDRSDFLEKVFLCGKMGRSLLTIDVPLTSRSMNESPERINKALNYLVDKGMIKVQLSGLRNRFSFANPNVDKPALLNRCLERFIDREEREIARIDRVVGLIKYQGCKVAYLLDYFGRPAMSSCGVCSFCQTQHQASFDQNVMVVLGGSEVAVLEELRKVAGEYLLTERAEACFLCGISSPATSRVKITTLSGDKVALSKYHLFGLFSKVPFEQVLDFVNVNK